MVSFQLHQGLYMHRKIISVSKANILPCQNMMVYIGGAIATAQFMAKSGTQTPNVTLILQIQDQGIGWTPKQKNKNCICPVENNNEAMGKKYGMPFSHQHFNIIL